MSYFCHAQKLSLGFSIYKCALCTVHVRSHVYFLCLASEDGIALGL